jgi:hypothetical protein
MNDVKYFLLLDAIITTGSALFSLAYYIKWKNGKTWVRVATFLLLGYFATVYILVLFGVLNPITYGHLYIRPALPALYVLSCADVIVDWRKNSANLADHLKRELTPFLRLSEYIETKTKTRPNDRK